MNNYEKAIVIIMYIYKYSSENNPVSIVDIKKYFKDEHSEEIDIRTINSVVDSFNSILNSDCTIETIKSRPKKFYIFNKPGMFLGEAKAIIDLVYSSHFFTEHTKSYFIKQIKEQFSLPDQNMLNKAINTHICRNEDSNAFYNSFESISIAIHNKSIISFDYIKPTFYFNDQPVKPRKDILPVETSCDNNNFYLYCYDLKEQKPKTYRIDYISNVKITRKHYEPDYKIIEDIKNMIIKSTDAYNPERNPDIKLVFDNKLYPNILDKFGVAIKNNINKYDDEHLIASIEKCPISPTFYGWLIGFGGRIKIIEPQEEINAFKMFLEKVV